MLDWDGFMFHDSSHVNVDNVFMKSMCNPENYAEGWWEFTIIPVQAVLVFYTLDIYERSSFL